jgi:hypothetical protein
VLKVISISAPRPPVTRTGKKAGGAAAGAATARFTPGVRQSN